MKVALLKNPPRKPIIWPWVLLISFVLFTVAPIAAFYVLFQDGATKQVQIQENFSMANMGKRLAVDSLDNAVEDEKLTMVVTENDMDNILESALNTTGVKSGFINKAYVDIDGNKYTFYVDLDAYVMRSRIKFHTVLRESEDHSTFYFDIKDMSVGMVSGLASPTKMIVQRFVNEQLVNNVFAQAGLSIKFDKTNYRLYYSKLDVMTDINKMGGGNNMGLYYNIMQTLVQRDMADFKTDSPNFLDVTMGLKELQTNECVTDDAKHIKVNHEAVTTQCKDKLIQLIEEGIFDPKQEGGEQKLKLLFSFLFNGGYAKLNEDNKEFIDSVDMTSIGITDKETYDGFGLSQSDTYLNDKMSSGLMTFDDLEDHKKDVTLLSEEDLNNYIAGRNVIGFTTLMHRPDGEKYKLNYVTVDNFYTNIYHNGEEQIAEFVCKVNINGYATSLTFVSSAEVNMDSITFTIKEDGIKFGEVSAPELNDQFFAVMADALNNGDPTVSADKENKTISMHFTNIIEEAKAAMKASAEAKYGGTYPPAVMDAIYAKIDTLFSAENASIAITGTDRHDDDSGLQLSLKVNDFSPTP